MNGIFIRWLTLTVAIIVTSYLFDGIHISGFLSAFWAAAILGILNALFRPLAFLVTLPINILTLGFFTFVINALMLKMASGVIKGFQVQGFWPAVFGSLMISIISWLLNSFINDRGSVTYYTVDHRQRHPGGDRPPNDTSKNTIDLENKGDHWE
jgi:putative membrane protein